MTRIDCDLAVISSGFGGPLVALIRVRRALEPYNLGGLCDPGRCNMYPPSRVGRTGKTSLPGTEPSNLRILSRLSS